MLAWILSSIALFDLGKREKIKTPGITWVPGFHLYTLGCLADKHDELNQKKDRKFRILGLVLSILSLVAIIVILVSCISLIAEAVGLAVESSRDAFGYGSSFDIEDYGDIFNNFGGFIASIFGFYFSAILAAVVVSISNVFQWIFLYKTLDLCRPSSVLLGILLSAIFGELAMGILLLIEKDYRNGEIYVEGADDDFYNVPVTPEYTPVTPDYTPVEPDQNNEIQ